jgi:hypothetical protein
MVKVTHLGEAKPGSSVFERGCTFLLLPNGLPKNVEQEPVKEPTKKEEQ